MKEDLGSFMELARVQSEINRLFDNLFDQPSSGGPAVAGKWVPNADVVESREQMVLRYELPGVEAASIKIAYAAGDLILSGEKPRGGAEAGARVHQSERGHGEFHRAIHLGISTNPRQASAVLRDGLLTIVLPKVDNRGGEEVLIPVREETSGNADKS
jgi:HSP20 family protein